MQTISHAPRSIDNARRPLLQDIEISLVDVNKPHIRATLRMQKMGQSCGGKYMVSTLEHRDLLYNLSGAILRRLFLPLIYLHPTLDLVWWDAHPISSDLLSSSDIFALNALGYALPAPTCVAPASQQDLDDDPALQSFLDTYIDVLDAAQHLGIDDEAFVKQFWSTCEDIEQAKEVKPSEEKLHEAIIDAVIDAMAQRGAKERKEQ